ncbi:hypothetical protein B0T13DRAFT_134046 [Neurospora crassa]|nr:hypothetical protein B0T13DRAFT_134046 [Neurospora crassa]
MEGPDSMNAGRGRIGLRKLGVARIGKAQNRLKIAMGPNCAVEWIIPVLPLLFGRLCVQGKGRDQARENQLHVVERVEREKDRPNGTTPRVRTIQEQVLLGRVALLVAPFEVAAVPFLAGWGGGPAAKPFLFFSPVPEGKGLGEMNRPLPLASQEPQSNKSPLSLAWRHLKVEDDGRKGRRAAHPLQGIDACQHRLDLSAGLRVETGALGDIQTDMYTMYRESRHMMWVDTYTTRAWKDG